jgi:dTDP-4-amino-4,6-dideoxygalactose transaminase
VSLPKDPQPRYRLYTRGVHYKQFFKDLILGGLKEDEEAIFRWERAVADRVGRRFGIATPTARMGIYLTLRALCEPGREVILSPLTIVDVINMVIVAGMKPVFADVDENGNLSPEAVSRLIHPRTGAVLLTHLFGCAGEAEELRRICDEKGVPLLEDCAQAFSARVFGRSVGTFGVAGIFSFGMYKNLTTVYGGMVVTDDPELEQRIRRELMSYPYHSRVRLLGKLMHMGVTDLATDPRIFPWLTYPIFRLAFLKRIGFLNRLVTVDARPRRKRSLPSSYRVRFTPFQARLGIALLEGVEEDTRKRIAHAKLYHEGLQGTRCIALPPLRTDGSHIYTYFPIRVKDRRRFLEFLFRQGRDVGASPYHNCAGLACFSSYHRPCPKAQRLSQELVQLPTYPEYREEEIARTIEVIRLFDRMEQGEG